MIYVDDTLAVSHKPIFFMDYLYKLYYFKESLADPVRCLSSILGKYEFDYRTGTWYQSTDEYLNDSIRVVDENVEASGKALLSRKINYILTEKYYPELHLSMKFVCLLLATRI